MGKHKITPEERAKRLEEARQYREEWHRLHPIKRVTKPYDRHLDSRLPKRKWRARRPKSKYGEPFPED